MEHQMVVNDSKDASSQEGIHYLINMVPGLPGTSAMQLEVSIPLMCKKLSSETCLKSRILPKCSSYPK